MKNAQLVLMCGLCAALAVTGCKSIEVERHAATLATITQTNGVVTAALDAKGNPIILDGGWSVDYFQHWTWTKLDTLSATAGTGVKLDINGYESGADSNLVSLVRTSLDGAALLAAKIGAAIATSGGSVAADGAKSAISSLVKRYVANGGDVKAAKVTCANGSCTISDGSVTETCADCYDCVDGACSDK